MKVCSKLNSIHLNVHPHIDAPSTDPHIHLDYIPVHILVFSLTLTSEKILIDDLEVVKVARNFLNISQFKPAE